MDFDKITYQNTNDFNQTKARKRLIDTRYWRSVIVGLITEWD